MIISGRYEVDFYRKAVDDQGQDSLQEQANSIPTKFEFVSIKYKAFSKKRLHGRYR